MTENAYQGRPLTDIVTMDRGVATSLRVAERCGNEGVLYKQFEIRDGHVVSWDESGNIQVAQGPIEMARKDIPDPLAPHNILGETQDDIEEAYSGIDREVQFC